MGPANRLLKFRAARMVPVQVPGYLADTRLVESAGMRLGHRRITFARAPSWACASEEDSRKGCPAWSQEFS